MLEEILQAEAAALREQLADHDTAAFTRRLARRIAEASEPPAPTASQPLSAIRAATGLLSLSGPCRTVPPAAGVPHRSSRPSPR
ncbi:hypothetical protein [Streptomyces sp. H39-C1]|uniref:hypothetical protein n=1 Tax=Streptomyces sp. H39-C1 TaxID=3004355 RepID=UPI0022AFB22B|nr:hypothetical protein [Streptomyces sp. H39-C1]MCZ4103015.1 hypothetical protein [Streptomyces sp. H39-C1]